MLDLNALSYYHFTDDYFHSLIKSDDFKIIAIFAELDGKKIAGSIFIITGGIMQYYLSGTVADYRKLAPSKAIIACAHKFAIDLGLSKLVLGGGVGSAKDSLFKFKTGFSDLSKPFYIFKKILNDVVYQDLCIVKKIDSKSISFFPAYRT
jgi:lipid II:glycine glycyltransferase (peptidoglycan interpeptide bridge formation enzyme)